MMRLSCWPAKNFINYTVVLSILLFSLVATTQRSVSAPLKSVAQHTELGAPNGPEHAVEGAGHSPESEEYNVSETIKTPCGVSDVTTKSAPKAFLNSSFVLFFYIPYILRIKSLTSLSVRSTFFIPS
jgi:hypothetical protein